MLGIVRRAGPAYREVCCRLRWRRVTVEEASPIGWERYAGPCGVVLGMHTFGMSAPMKVVIEHFGFEAEHVAAAAKSTIRRAAGGTSSQDDQFRS